MDSESLLRIKYESLYGNMQIIADKLRHLVSPLNAVKFYIDDLLEDAENKECKKRLREVNKVANKCLSAANDLLALTMPYFDSKSSK